VAARTIISDKGLIFQKLGSWNPSTIIVNFPQENNNIKK
jgi:hypothetical protein